MSISVMSLCWQKSQHTGTDLLMMLAIADFSGDNGKSYPAISTLAQKCRMSRRNVQYIIKCLQDSGELSVEPNKGPPPKFPNLYRINLNLLGVQPIARVQCTSRVQSSVARGAIQRTNGVQPIAPKPSVTIKNRQTLRFDEFWSAYPSCKRKGSKSECVKVWQSKNLDADANQIIGHVKSMATSDDWVKNAGAYIPAPLVYLRQARWDGAEVAIAADPFEGAL